MNFKRKGRTVGACAVWLCLIISCGARADDVCTIVALRDVAALDGPTTMMRAGSKQSGVTQYEFDVSTRIASFCQHGGLCWPETVTVDGHEEPAVRLTNCSVDRRHPSQDRETVFYELVPDRRRIPPSVMRESDVTDRLIALGLCNGCAHNAAAFYIRKPGTECGRLTKSALEGNPEALAALIEKQTAPTCQYWR